MIRVSANGICWTYGSWLAADDDSAEYDKNGEFEGKLVWIKAVEGAYGDLVEAKVIINGHIVN